MSCESLDHRPLFLGSPALTSNAITLNSLPQVVVSDLSQTVSGSCLYLQFQI